MAFSSNKFLTTFLTVCISAVWLINGLLCKVLNLVPRHQLIVARILGEPVALYATKAIGFLEILMVVWIVSKIKPRLCALSQILAIGTMNIIEFVLVPDLLLFGKVNMILAFLFMGVIYFYRFLLDKQTLPFSFSKI